MNSPTLRAIIYIFAIMALLYAILFIVITNFGSPLEPDSTIEMASTYEGTVSDSEFYTQTAVAQSGTSSIELLFSDAYQSFQNQEWTSADQKLEQIRTLDSAFRADEVRSLLAAARFNAGKALVADSSGTANRFYLAQSLVSQAAALEPENQEFQRSLEALNTFLLGDYQIRTSSPQQALQTLQPLYASSPDFLRRQVGERMYDLYLTVGDQAQLSGNTEAAVGYFTQAQDISEVSDKSDLASRLQSIAQ